MAYVRDTLYTPPAAPGGGGGAVDSVNTETGVVVLDATEIDSPVLGVAPFDLPAGAVSDQLTILAARDAAFDAADAILTGNDGALAAADSGLDSRLDVLELLGAGPRLTDLEADVAALDALELWVSRTVVAPSDESETVIGVTAGRLDDDLVLVEPSDGSGDRANVRLPAASAVLGQKFELKQLPTVPASPSQVRLGPSVYTLANLPAYLDLTAWVSQIAVADYTGTPDEYTFNVNGTPDTVLLNTDYVDLGGILGAVVAQLGGTGVVTIQPNYIDPRTGVEIGVALVTVATGAAAALDVTALNPDPSVSGLLVATGVDGETNARIGIDGVFGKGGAYTHAWPDGPDYSLVMQAAEVVATTGGWQALHWPPRAEYTSWVAPAGAFALTAQKNVGQALNGLNALADVQREPAAVETADFAVGTVLYGAHGTAEYSFYPCDPAGGPIVVSLPDAATGVDDIAEFTVADVTGACDGTNTITVDAAGADTINGAGSIVLNTAYAFVTIRKVRDSSTWHAVVS